MVAALAGLASRGVGSALQAIVSLSGELLSNLEPIDGAPEINKLVD